MSEICPNCGLPKELCICETLAKEEQKIKVVIETRRYGKKTTVIENISKDMKPEEILKSLKRTLACGGTYKDGKIELQGDHSRRIKDALEKLGFKKDQIEIEGR
ncbi:MAG: stress response translation initiation inhibitor YciH [Candidatus Aenigmarchaeota archaeon]|nr:stress response translation initiation inhibitor YciH [Candidatus Aenigmarchaeota archaeon]